MTYFVAPLKPFQTLTVFRGTVETLSNFVDPQKQFLQRCSKICGDTCRKATNMFEDAARFELSCSIFQSISILTHLFAKANLYPLIAQHPATLYCILGGVAVPPKPFPAWGSFVAPLKLFLSSVVLRGTPEAISLDVSD